MQFLLADIPRIMPEILLLVLALLVLGADVFERWSDDPEALRERGRASASLALLGLGMIFLIALVQSGYVFRLAPVEAAPGSGYFQALLLGLRNIVPNLQAGGPGGTPILGAFATDDLTMIGRLLFIGAAFLTVALTADDPPTTHPGEFYTLIVVSTLGMCVMAAASELIILFIAIELTSIPLYVLAGYFSERKQSAEAGMKYFLFGALSSAILLFGMSLVLGYAANTVALQGGTLANDLTQFARIANLAALEGPGSGLLVLGMLLMVAGIGYKVAVVPFHAWSPDVYQGAPTPITAFIATASKAAGFVLLFRVLSEALPSLTGSAVATDDQFLGWASALALLALLTLVIGNLAALPQTNAKRLLAYSSIAHAGFLLLGIIAWSAELDADRLHGLSSLLYYLVVYTLTNLGAFGALAVIASAAGGDDLRDLHGLAQRNLSLAVLFAVFVLSLAGIPPLAGFFAKFYIFVAAWQAGARWLVIVAIITTVISLYYYLRLLKAAFLNPPDKDAPAVTAPRSVQAVLVVAAVLVLALGVYPSVLLQIFDQVQILAVR